MSSLGSSNMLRAPTLHFITPLIRVPVRTKKYFRSWRRPYSLNDYFNLSQAKPDVYQQWEAEWEAAAHLPRVLKAFDINRLPHSLVSRAKSHCLPVEGGREQLPGYQRRLFGIYGLASGVDPGQLLDSCEFIAREREIKEHLEPDIDTFKAQAAKRRQEEAQKTEERMQRISANLERLPAMLEKYEAAQAKKAAAVEALQAKKKELLEQARDRFGYYVDTRDPKFIRLVEEKEAQAKLERKAAKRK
ncbi:unnamed protein product [Schistocephalus solidus]|uniref:Large ribosomal subunit protein mL64 n=1 Tax=Schistocephalus solidus TaxID=70667 RepID=A0A0X3PWH4_SCHSO|nr:unnamed protein product [Schistocephalus solidus]